MNKRILLPLLLPLLTACSAQRFDCPYKEGVRCLPLSEVDKRIDTHTLHSKSSSHAFKKRFPLSKSSTTKALEPLPPPLSPLRSQAEVLTVWIAPYQTEDDTYHEEKRIHFVVREPQWLNVVQEIKESDENL